MYDTSHLSSVKKHHSALDRARRSLQALSAEILGAAKRAIFAVQRNDQKTATAEIARAIKNVKEGKKIVAKESRLAGEGMWRAALEEYAEAALYLAAMTGGKVGRVAELPEDPDIYLGGFCDLTGELLRSCVLAATDRKSAEVTRLVKAIRDAVAWLLTLNLTGTQRTKFDQAKQNLRKAEEVAFSLAMNAHDHG
jgi:predicted translin family RNA/ssDNA-binding protein